MANKYPEDLKLGAAEHQWTNEIHVVLPNMAKIWSNKLTESLNDEGSHEGGEHGDDDDDEKDCPAEVSTTLDALMKACPGTCSKLSKLNNYYADENNLASTCGFITP